MTALYLSRLLRLLHDVDLAGLGTQSKGYIEQPARSGKDNDIPCDMNSACGVSVTNSYYYGDSIHTALAIRRWLLQSGYNIDGGDYSH